MNVSTRRIVAASLAFYTAAGHLIAQVTLTNLYSFTSSGSQSTNGYFPVAGLVQGSDGNFYGTTQSGGGLPDNGGTVFRVSPSGSLMILWTFTGGFDGLQPKGGLVQGSDGRFYGSSSAGGTNNGGGVVFQISPDGSSTTLTTLHTFHESGDPNDGSGPQAGVVEGNDRYFYGTTWGSGISGLGTIYRVDSTGSSYATLHSFTNNPDGAVPRAGLVRGSDGSFYGTTSGGGTNGGGTVFQYDTNGSLAILHSFGSGSDGRMPLAGLVQGSDGNFYGTTYTSGVGEGIVFRISSGGSYSNLHTFTSAFEGSPQAGLVQGSDGNFYGTASDTGAGYGTIFRIGPDGSYSNLYTFGGTNGELPVASLVQGSDGNFYGTSSQGGTNSPASGTVFKLTVPLNPPANQISAIQVAGTNVLVTIPSVAAEIYQLQNRASLTAGAWANVGTPVTSIGGSLTVTNFGGFSQSQQFYRFAITP